MPVSPYITKLRAHVGHDLLLLPGVSAVVRNPAGQVLLARRSDTGKWSLPAGMVDPGEQPSQALLREVYEETGVHVEIERVGGVATHPVTYPNGDVCEYLAVWFRCRAVGGEARVNDEESTEVGWFDPDDLPELDDWATLRVATTEAVDAATWYARPDADHPELRQPAAI